MTVGGDAQYLGRDDLFTSKAALWLRPAGTPLAGGVLGEFDPFGLFELPARSSKSAANMVRVSQLSVERCLAAANRSLSARLR